MFNFILFWLLLYLRRKKVARENFKGSQKPNQFTTNDYFIYTMSYIYALKAIMQEDRYFTVSSF